MIELFRVYNGNESWRKLNLQIKVNLIGKYGKLNLRR